MNLRGKAVVVTGAGQGIGKAYARAILDEGGSVVANDIDDDLLAQLAEEWAVDSDRLVTHRADITDWTAAEGLIAASTASFGRLDGLVNNAGVYDVRRADENDAAVIRLQVDVNVLGTMYCGIHAMRSMLKQQGGSIINTTSGAMVGLPLRGIYSATKAAVAALTWSWAQDLQGTNVRVNAISPLARTRQLDVAAAYLQVDHDQLMRNIPPEANAPIITYLLSDAADDIRGQIVRISDDLLTLIHKPDVVRPGVHLPASTIEAVGEAFDEELRHHLEPVGAPNWSPVGGQTTVTAKATAR
ncbi:SDR family NAD(P)-dependent oxidoreductase [Aeromicrobium wangtongii]|uniref:SDR family oxidoreductase n=1 Tax=Aeromicrobium wangtongii TaxID=2969247 RepID=A0ABY5M8K3_9ACTN|nr:SDR family oxidoreductase [Aeromicrobium wangtongii]MCD9196960.1 SDR family oxidoreductase [Aeromicrobium wangtongii]UUP14465.1 SDR family oxidoreductase [Aeromicrobium wangtongii]